MPMYEYRCESCGLVFEVRQKFSDPPVTTCTACGGPVEKLISLSGFQLKGSGWYKSGYFGCGTPSSSCPRSGGESSCCADCPKASNG